MYQLTAVFNANALPDVLQGLYDEHIEGITVNKVTGKGGYGITEKDLDAKVMILIVVSNETFLQTAMEVIRSNTQDTGHGSGKMWVTPVLEVERIRTGEKNAAALSKSSTGCSVHNQAYEIFNAVDTPAS